ncbi:MAG: hypothetical protein LBC57_09610 [Treponema sp.]|jgi:hypothetical protein|nr:hypothetical protein [Treponema sp.]
MNISSKLSVEEIEAQLSKAIQAEEPIIITTYTFPHEMDLYIGKLLSIFFNQIQKEQITDYIVYGVRELIGNAKKANTKRIFFAEKGLDINNEEDYVIGMSRFKEETFKNLNHYLQLQKEKGLYIKLMIQMKEELLNIEVRNNVKITEAELRRIEEKFLLAKKFNSMDEVITQVMDTTEGSGLGLIILILMMRKMGIDKENLRINNGEQETVVKIALPLEAISPEEIEEVEDIEEIEEVEEI